MQDIKKKVIERVVLVGVNTDNAGSGMIERYDPLNELRLLALTAGAEVVGSLSQNLSRIDSSTYIGKGKLEELSEIVEQLEATSVIFNNDLAPGQVSNLEKILSVKVIDRSGIILDIFALRAQTREAKTQVELAQLKYLLPRLTRQWTHLSRQVGGIGTRGPGETQLEVDRRRVRARIGHLERTLKTIEKRRSISRKHRTGNFRVALVGYTNAGKSTLLNTLSGAGVPVENKLFKTLDSVTRKVKFESFPEILLSDTVGFIRNLPHDLIASFRTTLEEVRDADLLLNVVDISDPLWEAHIDVVNSVLADLEVSGAETILVFNKIDCLEDTVSVSQLQSRFPEGVFISAHNNIGIDKLLDAMKQSIQKKYVTRTMTFGADNGLLLNEIYRFGTVLDTHSTDEGISLTFTMSVPSAKKLGVF